MPSEEVITEDSVDSLSELSSLDDEFAKMHFKSASSDEEVTDNEVDSNVWCEIKTQSDGECLEDYVKWYQKVAFELIFGTSIVNSYLIYKENYATDNISILQFGESLVRSLLVGMPSEKLKPDPREQSISYLKRKLADHKLKEKEGSAREVRRRCAGCYEKIREEESREPSLAAATKTKALR